MYVINKIVGVMVDPAMIGWAIVVASAACLAAGVVKKWARWGLGFGLVWLWIWSTTAMAWLVGGPLEREWLVEGRVPRVESYPSADAIVVLGGGMGGLTNVSDYAEMWYSADRVWQAARLWQAGKAPRVIATGGRTSFTTKGLLTDFGIPENAIAFIESARNTEEEAKSIRGLKRILLVTSAWHTRRAKLLFEKYAPEVEIIPAPADFEGLANNADGFKLESLLPSGEGLMWCRIYLKEWIGYLGYKLR